MRSSVRARGPADDAASPAVGRRRLGKDKPPQPTSRAPSRELPPHQLADRRRRGHAVHAHVLKINLPLCFLLPPVAPQP